jgi:hypothetical protein
VTSPGFNFDAKKTIPAKRSGGVRLKRIQYWLGFAKRGNDCMNVIGSDINRAQSILAMEADFTNCLIHYGSLLRVERHWLML